MNFIEKNLSIAQEKLPVLVFFLFLMLLGPQT